MIKRALQALPGILLFLLGLSAVIGWLAKIPVLLRPDVSFMPVSFGGAICFCLSGMGLFCFAFSGRYCRYTRIASGCLLFFISALVLAEYLFHLDLGVDHLVSTEWIAGHSIYSGRIAINTAMGFLLTGLIFILFSFTAKKSATVIIELSIFLLFLLGMLSGLGYFFNVEALYSWSTSTHMSIYSAVIFTLLSICFWYFWRQNAFLIAEKELNEINARLKKSEARYALAVRGSSAGLWDWEVGTDNVFYSPYLKNLLGYTDEELPNSVRSFTALLHPDDAARANTMMKEHILHHVPYQIEYRLKRKSGEYHWFQVVGQAEWDEHGHATRVAGSILDVTERKVNERRLSMQYAVTQILSEAENLDDALSRIVHIICMSLNWDYGAIWLVNTQKNQLDYVSSWHHDKNEIAAFLVDRRKITFAPGTGVLGRVWSSGKPYWNQNVTEDVHFLHKDAARKAHLYSGFYFPMMLQNNVFGVMEFYNRQIESPDERLLQMMAAIGPQISQFIQRKYVEDELRQSEAHKSAILNAASDGIITISEDGLIVSFNLQTDKMFGYSKTELRNKNINDLIPGVTDRLHEIVNTLPIEFLSVNKNGDHFPVELTVSGMQMNGKNIYVLIVRDITERKKVEKLKNEFISIVSHELRTPLTSIRGSLGLVLGGVVGQFSDKAKNLLDIANNNCERLLHLINDILDIEKIESGKMNFHFSQVDIAEIVRESIVSNQMYGEKFGVRIVLVESVSDVRVNVDPDRMLQVLANLISNAVKFSKQGDSVDIAIRVLNNTVRVSVTDRGSGIPADFQSRVFQKFSQADTTTTRGKGGTGLGLNITKSIIEKFGGSIDFVSEPDKQTVFYFDLPVSVENENDKKPVDEKTTASTQKSLLVCEDDEDQAQYIKAMLESAGFDVDIALTAQEARQSVSKKNYQGLLLDLILPDQDGISFIRELRGSSRTKDLPIIVMSVIAKTGHSLLNGDAFTVLDWLDKPIDFSKLLKSVSSLKRGNTHLPAVMHVEDDIEARKIIRTLLQDVAHVVCAKTLQEAKIKLMHERFDLVILDLLLPDGKGTELLPLLAKSATPVIVFSAVELDREHSEFVKEAFVKSETSHEKLFTLIEKIIHSEP
ncbi:MAG TPA: PAS domain S-box protein [Gammaproteobacteria bacterium]|nr:PAS domain S-box protein [Gammaproteobacteria bacterium]